MLSSSDTNVSIDDNTMAEGSGKIVLELHKKGPRPQQRAVGGPVSKEARTVANRLLPTQQPEAHPKRKAADSSSDSSCCSSSEEDDEHGNDHGGEDQPRTSSVSLTKQRLLDNLSKAIRRHNDHGACMLALASRISESTIHHHDNVPANEETHMLPNKRARYQRRNSFVIHRNPEQQHGPPPSLLQGQDLEEAMHQSVPEFYQPDPRPIRAASQDLLSALHLHHNAWGNASWSNPNDTDRYTFASLTSSSGSSQNKRIFPMPMPPKGGFSGVGGDGLFPFPLPASRVDECGCESAPTTNRNGL